VSYVEVAGLWLKKKRGKSYKTDVGARDLTILRQGDLPVLKYERRFRDLATFASAYLSTERYRVERSRDGLK
jgi:hypothetical protein